MCGIYPSVIVTDDDQARPNPDWIDDVAEQ